MSCRRFRFTFALISICLTSPLLSPDGRAQTGEPTSSPVAISDQPLPVLIERAFPQLTFRRPVYLTYPPDGSDRIVILSQYGSILAFPNSDRAAEAKTWLDIEDKVAYKDHENEEGLLGMAFHPRFKENREFFVYYTLKQPAHTSVISRFRVSKDDPDRVDPDSEEEILRIKQPYWNHNGGTIVFGPDGYLYIGMGDGGRANDPHGNGQKMATLLGKVLRIDVDHKDKGQNYASPKDNPFVDLPGARPEIWALGVRNIWRMAFDPETGELWAGDVGQDLWEEVDIIHRGGNYGWNLREGFRDFTPLNPIRPGPPPEKIVGTPIDPIFEYHHDIGKSITGGAVYRGQRVTELIGAYLFADYVTGQVYALHYDAASGKTTSVQPIKGNTMPIFSFGEDEHREIYFLTDKGTVHRFRSAP